MWVLVLLVDFQVFFVCFFEPPMRFGFFGMFFPSVMSLFFAGRLFTMSKIYFHEILGACKF